MDGKTLYHAGDTGLFLDMKLIGELDPIDNALLPIGDNFTMGIDDAVKAAEFLKTLESYLGIRQTSSIGIKNRKSFPIVRWSQGIPLTRLVQSAAQGQSHVVCDDLIDISQLG